MTSTNIFENRLIILLFILQLPRGLQGVHVVNLQSPWCYSGQDVGVIKRLNVGVIASIPCIKRVKYKMDNQNLFRILRLNLGHNFGRRMEI